MATINNKDLTKELIDGAKIQLSFDDVPGRLASAVVPTMEVNPKLLKKTTYLGILSGRASTGSGILVYRGTDDKKVNITNINIANVQDATSDNVLMSLKATINGVVRTIWTKRKATTTAVTTNDNLYFNPALKIDKNTDIIMDLLFTAGTSILDVSILGFLED